MKLKAKYKPELICSRDEMRKAISEPRVGLVLGKVSLSATDGRKLVVVPIEAEESEFGTIQKEALQLARQKRESRREEMVSVGVNGCITLANGWTLPRPKQEDFNYPNVDQVIPINPPKRIGFNAKFLAQIATAMGVENVTLSFQDDMSAILVTSHNEEAYGVLMPVRIQ